MIQRLTLRLLALLVLSTGLALGGEPRELRVDLKKDLALTAALSAAAFGISALGPSSHCLICGSNGLDQGARNVFRLETPGAMRNARVASSQLVSLVMPVGALLASGIPALRHGEPRDLLDDAIVITQAVLLASDLNALAKQRMGRSRPEDAVGQPTGRSFYSSHTSRAFALAVATATVATIRGRRSARWLWIGGLALASGVGYLRLASDSHWLTDVAAGAVAGSAVGFSVPWFMHRGRRLRRFSVGPAPGGLAVRF